MAGTMVSGERLTEEMLRSCCDTGAPVMEEGQLCSFHKEKLDS